LSSCKKVVKKYYDNGVLKEEYEILYFSFLVRSVKNGYVKSYHTNGKLKETYHYRVNKMNGPYESYFENGNINRKGFFHSDSIIKMETYEENGLLHSEYLTSKLFRVNRYYKDNSIFRQDFLEDTPKSKYPQIDSSIIYKHNPDDKTSLRRLLKLDYSSKHKKGIVFFYSSLGSIYKTDTVAFGSENVFKLLGKDSIQIGIGL